MVQATVSLLYLLGQNLIVGSYIRGVSLPPDGQEEKRPKQGAGENGALKSLSSATCFFQLYSTI